MKYISLVFIFIFLPCTASAAVRITEIAWMGTSESQYGEWIELYNSSPEPVSLLGWKLYSDGGTTLVYTFKKSIGAEEYLVAERTTPSTPDPLPSINDETGPFSGNGFSNAGEDVVLKDQKGTTIDSLSYARGWPAGDAKTSETMQWNGEKWITAVATPKANVPSLSESDTPNKSSKFQTLKKNTEDNKQVLPIIEPHIVFRIPQTIFQSVPYIFDIHTVPEAFNVSENGRFVWNMGDGTVIEKKHGVPIEHIYTHPGKYTISFAYYKWKEDTTPFIRDTKIIDVVTPDVSINMIDGGTALQIKNKTSKIVELSGWTIKTPQGFGIIPTMTYVAPNATIVILTRLLGYTSAIPSASLITSAGLKVAETSISLPNTQNNVMYQENKSARIEYVPQSSEPFDTGAIALESIETENNDLSEEKKKSHTRFIIFGVAFLLVIGFCLLLERFMARQE